MVVLRKTREQVREQVLNIFSRDSLLLAGFVNESISENALVRLVASGNI